MNEMPWIYNTNQVSTNWGGGTSVVSKEFIDNHKFDLSVLMKQPTTITTTAVNEEEEPMSDKRLVRVLVVDPDENVPVGKSVLHDGKEQLTDLTDEELFFEIELKDALAKHNEYRQTIRDKEIKDREEFLEPCRIRDLSMFVVTIAAF